MLAVICGSIRSSLDDLRRLELDLTRSKYIVLFPVPIPAEDHDPYADAMHLYRIQFAFENGGVLFATPKPDGTFGTSTQREIDYGDLLGMPVRLLLSQSITPAGLAFWLAEHLEDRIGAEIPDWIENDDSLRAVWEEHANV